MSKPQVMWMVKTGYIAPYYGIASTRRWLKRQLSERRIVLPPRASIVKVLVAEVIK